LNLLPTGTAALGPPASLSVRAERISLFFGTYYLVRTIYLRLTGFQIIEKDGWYSATFLYDQVGDLLKLVVVLLTALEFRQ